jgi:hypothetical protein
VTGSSCIIYDCNVILTECVLRGARYSDGLDGWGSILVSGKRFFSTPQCPYRLWGPLLYSGDWGLFPWVKWPVREANNLPVSSTEVKMVELYLHSLIRLHGVALNQLSTGTTTLLILPLCV